MDFFNWNHGSYLFLFKSSHREQTHPAHRAPTSRWAGRFSSVLTWEGVLLRRQDDLITLLALLILEKQKNGENDEISVENYKEQWSSGLSLKWDTFHLSTNSAHGNDTGNPTVGTFHSHLMEQSHRGLIQSHLYGGSTHPAGNVQGWVRAPIPK